MQQPQQTDKKQPGALKDHVYRTIIEMICSGELNSSDIFTEKQMIEKFGVSKSPVREALTQLCHEEALHSIPRRGYQVVEIGVQKIHDLTELRLLLELSSLKKLTEKLDDEKLQQLRGLARSKQRDVWAAWHHNNHFHLRLASYAGNQQVTEELNRAIRTCTRAYAQLFSIQPAVISTEKENYHEKIVSALERHEIFTAHLLLKKDILLMEELLLTQV